MKNTIDFKNQEKNISVLMPAYNADKYIGTAIQSILNQTYKSFELIIIDDCSSDNTWNIIQKFCKNDKRIIAYKNNSNINISKSLNIGLGFAKGKYIIRMDADDLSYPDRIEKQYMFMEKNPNIILSGSAMEVCDSELKTIAIKKFYLTDKEIRKNLLRCCPFSHPSIIFRTEIAKKAGEYNININTAQDYEFYFRMGLYGQFANIAEPLIKYRLNIDSDSTKNNIEQNKMSLYIRLKAIMEYKYKMRYIDCINFVIQATLVFIMPSMLKAILYFRLRHSK